MVILEVRKVYRAQRSVYLFLCVAAACFFFPFLASAEDAGYRDALIADATGKNLSSNRYWDILMHYRPAGRGRKSLVDDQRFFLSADGRTDPSAELTATIKGLFDDPALGDEHPQCRFVARAAWLKEQLKIDASRLPVVKCAKYEESMANITTKSATLIFPAAHGNGPASMFGHTLIRIDSPYQSELLTYAVNYAAKADDTNGFLYAFKGIFGFYKGYYSILPYYVKVNEYNHIEHRDIWEYSLNLSEQEVRRMVMHIWELRDVSSTYYFFTENCSYNLLFLLEAARPSVHLTDEFRERVRFWVIPSDTVRVVVESGLVGRLTYRPSLATRITARESDMSGEDRRLALDVVNNTLKPGDLAKTGLAVEEERKVLDLATEVVQYRYSRKDIGKDEYLGRFLPVLNARSALGGASEDPAASIAEPVPPDKGHLPGMIGAGIGSRDNKFFGELSWRAAYHDLMDPSEGYVEGAQINFFDIHVRDYTAEDSVKLQSFRLLDILSLAPRDLFFKPVSWKVVVGFDRSVMADGEDHLVFRLNPGGGAAYESKFFGLSYVMMESDLQMSRVLDREWTAGVGASAGIYRTIIDGWKVNLSGKTMFYPLGDTHRTFAGVFRSSLKLATNAALEATVERERSFDHYRTDAVASVNIYY
jgi:hypothetical protein